MPITAPSFKCKLMQLILVYLRRVSVWSSPLNRRTQSPTYNSG
jgi:hypothetical protein